MSWEQTVLAALKCLYDEDQGKRDAAEESVQTWKKTPGFCSVLDVSIILRYRLTLRTS